MNQDITKPYQYDPSLSMRDNQEAAEQHALERRRAQQDAKRRAHALTAGENREERWPQVKD